MLVKRVAKIKAKSINNSQLMCLFKALKQSSYLAAKDADSCNKTSSQTAVCQGPYLPRKHAFSTSGQRRS